MGRAIVLTETTDIPLHIMGELSGLCWGSDTKNHEKNYKRGLDCLRSNHGRVLEFVQVYISLEGYSARVIRELYTHIGGDPTRLQESTRYVDYSNFKYVIPQSIAQNEKANYLYQDAMCNISKVITQLTELGVAREDAALLLPLGMETKIVLRTNLRNLVDMSRQRKCQRANWEFRKLFKDIEESLAFYSEEWKFLVEEEKIFAPKCEVLNYCPEKYSCGRKPSKEDFEKKLQMIGYMCEPDLICGGD